MQDILGLKAEGHMNRPGTLGLSQLGVEAEGLQGAHQGDEQGQEVDPQCQTMNQTELNMAFGSFFRTTKKRRPKPSVHRFVSLQRS
ncbi:MAG: hypothetical protein V8T10_09340 [Merdibacter sp.]